MKKNIINLFTIMGLFYGMVNAQDKPKEENKKPEIITYGFIKADAIYASSGVYSWGNAANCYLSSPQFASGVETPAIGFTAQHTRFGIKRITGDKIKVGGIIETDFYGGAFDANIKPRLRQAYASIATKGFEARLGQQWDIFSPNNANTNNTNGNLWYAGNRGFRRTQLQLSYKKESDKFSPMIQASFGEAAKEEFGLGNDNNALFPMIQGRLSAKYKNKYEMGLSYVTAGYLEKNVVFVADTVKEVDYKTSGICLDFNLQFHKYFSLLGEFNIGTNLNNANLFSVAGNHTCSYDTTSNIVKHVNKESMGMWFNASSIISDHFQIVVGYGMDKNNTSNLADGVIEGNMVVYGDLIFPIKHGFSLALEVQNIKTMIKNKVDRDANIINLSAKVNF